MNEKLQTIISILDLCPTVSTHTIEQAYIFTVLKRKNWNRTQTAKALGISIRCLRIKMNQMKGAGFIIPDSKHGCHSKLKLS